MKDLKTLWGKFIAIIYVSSFVFSLVAIILTVIGMSRWWFVREAFQPSQQIFSTFGLFWGAVLIGLWSAGSTFGPLILMLLILRHVENEKFTVNLIHFLCRAIIEAYGVLIFATSFLDMYNDLFLLHLILYGRIVDPPLTPTFIISLTNPLFLIVFVFSFSFRTGRLFKSKRPEKRVLMMG